MRQVLLDTAFLEGVLMVVLEAPVTGGPWSGTQSRSSVEIKPIKRRWDSGFVRRWVQEN